MIAGVLFAALELAAGNAALSRCRALDEDFATLAMPKPCQAAAEDTTLSLPERVEALRLLGQAHLLNGNEALAAPAFMKMLVLSPIAELPGDAGPRLRTFFATMKRRFAEEGALVVAFAAPPQPELGVPLMVQVDVTDKLGRIVGARVTTRSSAQPGLVAEETLVRTELSPGTVRFTGGVPEPKGALPVEGATLTYEVVFHGWDTAALPLNTPVTGEFRRPGPSLPIVPIAVAEPSEEAPWALIGVGGGVLVAGAVTAGVVYCFTAGPCRTQDAWVRVQIQQARP